MALVSAVVDREHRPTGTREVVRARDRFGQRGELDQISGCKLKQLHRPTNVTAHQDALGCAVAVIDVGQKRPPRAQQGADGIGRRRVGHHSILTVSRSRQLYVSPV
jgi:hypothetical protein